MSEETLFDSEAQTEEAPAPEQISVQETVAEETPTTEQDKPEAEAKPERTFTQDELDKIVQKRVAKERKHVERAAAAEREAQMLREQMQRLQAPEPQAAQGMPQPAQFQDYESYISALTDWKVDQKLSHIRQESNAQAEARHRAEQAQTVQQKLSSASEKYDDFEEVALSPNVPITQYMAQAIAESDVAGDLAYYLGSNLKEAIRISQMSPIGQVRELTKIETKLANVVPEVSKAPPPTNPVGTKAKAEKDPTQMSVEEFTKWRKGYIARRHA
jgi:hypothetical protein